MDFQKLKNLYHLAKAISASIYYGFPGKKIKVIGVTGTDGKTTTTHLIHHILTQSGIKASMISSVYAEIGGKKYDTGFHVTSPDPKMLQRFLKQAVESGDEYVVLEVTSHGLDQYRVWGVDFDIGVLTNITHEHLDYHKTYPQYLKTKEKLLRMALVSIISRDDESYELLDTRAYSKIITYGIKKSADVTPKKFSFTSPLPGEYNTYNCLAAIAASKNIGLDSKKITHALKTFSGIKGRFEYIRNNKGITIIIDFAHTPHSIEMVLQTIRSKMKKGKLIHVFGSAGLRDFAKRPKMGKNSAAFADYIVLTEEDYRTENVDQIIEEIAQGTVEGGAVIYLPKELRRAVESNKKAVFKIPRRNDAVTFAISKLAKKGDTVVLTGKAHEKSLCRGTVEYPWSEHEAVKEALSKR